VGQLHRLDVEFGFSSCFGAGLRANRAAAIRSSMCRPTD
jgi:hypothetical protein